LKAVLALLVLVAAISCQVEAKFLGFGRDTKEVADAKAAAKAARKVLGIQRIASCGGVKSRYSKLLAQFKANPESCPSPEQVLPIIFSCC
jgi:hypothetical protein